MPPLSGVTSPKRKTLWPRMGWHFCNACLPERIPEATLWPISRRRDDRQEHVRGVRGVMKNALLSDAGCCVVANGRAGVEVAVKAREVAAADLEADGMTGAESIGRHPAVDGEFLDLPGRQEFGRAAAIAVATADDPIAEIPGRPIREDVDELGGEIGVRAIGG